ncbi:hypothetical protein M3Y95_00583000 [Aphelenchoides besseyi]|nr:hypothetical protein M3Y95_00583000 [Aphelenchoides besseyi]
MDTLHGIEKEIKFDWTEIASERINKICTLNICFLNGENVCGTIVHRPSSLHGGNLTLFVGTFNFVDCVLKLKRTKEHEGSLLLMKFTANPPSIFFFNNMIRYATINIESLSLENVIPLPRGLGLPIIRNGNLCGFDHPDAKKMIKISLTDGTTKEHAIAEKDRVNIKHRTKPISVSMGNKFLFGLDDCSNETSTVFEFDLTTLKFTKTGIQTSGYSTQFATNDHLMLYTCKNFEDEYLDNDHYKWIVSRFQFGKVSPLANLTWEAMRRYSRFNPEFYVWFMSKLSVNSKFRPIW